MNNTLFILIMIAIYLIAAIPTGVVIARLMGGEDVRQKGSGNIGATNVYRVAGKLAGVLTLVGDTLKGFLPLLAFKTWLEPTPTQLGIASAVAILGHCYPVYLKFKGGKGVATSIGVFARYRVKRPVPGFLQSQPSASRCGQMKVSSNSIPCEASKSTM